MPTDGRIYRFCTIRDVLYLAGRVEDERVGCVNDLLEAVVWGQLHGPNIA